jgi:hypothetical protein
MTAGAQRPKLLLIGVGDVTIRVAHLLASGSLECDLVLASRTIERATRFANLTKFAASNLGRDSDVKPLEVELSDIENTAELIAEIQPDLIFMGASIQAARAIMDLPKPIFEQLDQAQLGPWLPMHLTLVYELMQAVRIAECSAIVVNAAYPDAVGPALETVGLAPHIGIGNIANIVPGLRWAAAEELEAAPGEVTVNLICHHYFSHHVHRFGEAEGIPYTLTVFHLGEKVEVDQDAMFARLASSLRRQGGKDGQQVTATSAARVIYALLREEPTLLHSPAPHGRPGGYPLAVSNKTVELDLIPEVSEASAVKTNRLCQQLDGIDEIAPDGSIWFGAEQMTVMRDLLSYDCSVLKVEDARAAATELGQKYEEFVRSQSLMPAMIA